MKYRQLGNSGLQVSEISLGGWLTLGGHVDEPLSVRLIEHAFYCGVNLFDMADVYSGGQSEVMLGKALKNLPRDQVIVATKVMGRMHDGLFGAGLSKKHILQACDASLKRLGTHYIDLYQFHAPDKQVPLEESLEALDILVRQGKVLYVGCSNFSPAEIQKGLDISNRCHYPRFISNQPCYNMLERDAERELFPLCRESGIGNIVYSPLAHGVLTGKYKKGQRPPSGSRSDKPGGQFMSRYLTEENLEKVDKAQKIADKLETSLAKLSLAWVLRKEEVSSAIIGATSIEQLDENLEASELSVDRDAMDKLEAIFS